ncbi:hypothetical protein [Pantoea agglomerans]|jgi:hypothetical protein|uniref:hypothetical protein n=1 Tax=Enterobacter agglomerans TaxID=549 RepID=UPI003C7E3574
MAKTCIVCGNTAGSGEHVFPASLGGRRVNSGIYCSRHDNSYSGLVSEIADQLDFINAYLGVRPDHSKNPKTAYALHKLTGETVSFSAEGINFTKPRILSRTAIGDHEQVYLGFPNHQSVKKFITAMETKGYSFSLLSKPIQRPYITDVLHFKRSFGGPCGLGAIAYIAQTFFAQEFPEIARTEALSDFIHYTQAIARIAALGTNEQQRDESEKSTQARQELAKALEPFEGKAPVWWDFTHPADISSNAFDFGHRVTVGIDGNDGQIYGRVALFSTFTFSLCFGEAPRGSITREVSVDINPLANHPPHDIVKTEMLLASGRVQVPDNMTEQLSWAISTGAQQRLLENLMHRLQEYQLLKISESLSVSFAHCATMSSVEARELIGKELDQQLQTIWNLVTFVVQGLRDKMTKGGMENIVTFLNSMIAPDVHSASGLSPLAEVTLFAAKAALLTQMEQDYAAGELNEKRIAELMGRGPGLYVVGNEAISPLLFELFDGSIAPKT